MTQREVTKYQALNNVAQALQDALDAGWHGADIINYATNYVIQSLKGGNND